MDRRCTYCGTRYGALSSPPAWPLQDCADATHDDGLVQGRLHCQTHGRQHGAFVWSTSVNVATNRLHFDTLFELVALVAIDTAHLPMVKLFELLTDSAKVKFVISKLPKTPAPYHSWFEENVDKCLTLVDLFKHIGFEEGCTGNMLLGTKGSGMLSNLTVDATPARFDGTHDWESVELAMMQRENVLNSTWIQAAQEYNDGNTALWDTLWDTLTHALAAYRLTTADDSCAALGAAGGSSARSYSGGLTRKLSLWLQGARFAEPSVHGQAKPECTRRVASLNVAW